MMLTHLWLWSFGSDPRPYEVNTKEPSKNHPCENENWCYFASAKTNVPQASRSRQIRHKCTVFRYFRPLFPLSKPLKVAASLTCFKECNHLTSDIWPSVSNLQAGKCRAVFLAAKLRKPQVVTVKPHHLWPCAVPTSVVEGSVANLRVARQKSIEHLEFV